MTDEPKALKDQRIQVLMSEGEVQAVDDWAFANRIKSRGEAIRRLCTIGLLWDQTRGGVNNSASDAYDSLVKVVELLPTDQPMTEAQTTELFNAVMAHAADFDLLIVELVGMTMPSRPLITNPDYHLALQEAAAAKVRALNFKGEAEVTDPQLRGRSTDKT